jgi:4-amino-4-deoxy-L-arabinose transferase-like glycosyltransferase
MRAERAANRSRAVWLLPLLAAMLGGAVLRLLWLDAAPPALHFDEAVYGLMARMIGRGNWPVFFHTYTGREPLYMYMLAGVFRLLGSSGVTLRLTSALIGIAAIPLVFLLCRELFSTRVGVLAAAVTAANYWHLSMSRNGYPNILIPPIECLAMTFLWRGYRDRRWAWAALGGAFVGAVLYTYLAARLFPITLALFFLYALAVEPRRFFSRVGLLALAVAAAVIVFAPLGYHFYRNPADFYERASQVLVFETAGDYMSAARLMAGNLLQNLAGLFWRGDPRWLFNLPGKPALTPPLACFGLIGLLAVARRWRQPEYALLPIWVLGMCLPAVLTADAMPQSQRISGITPALFGLVALGLDRVIELLRGRMGAGWKAAPAFLVGALLLLEGLHAGSVYFDVWAREPLNYYRFHGEYAALARHAAPHLQAGDTVVVIAEHYQHPTALYEAGVMREALWLVVDRTVVVPHREGGAVLYYWPQDPFRGLPFVQATLLPLVEPVATILDPQGDPAVRVYRLAQTARGDQSAAGALASLGEIEVVGWEAPATARRDEPLLVTMQWRVRERTTQGRTFSVHLVDEQGHRWSQHTDLGFMPEQWRPGDLVFQQFAIPLPQGIPAGRYSLRFLVDDSRPSPFAVLVEGQPAGFYLPLGEVALLGEGAYVAALAPEGEDMGPLRLVDHTRLTGQVLLSPRLVVEATWQALERPGVDYAAQFELLGADGQTAHSAMLPLAYQYATAEWAPGEVVLARYELDLPELPAGSYHVLLSIPGLPGSLDLGPVQSLGALRRYQAPPMQHETRAQIGQDVLLLGYDLGEEQPAPGNPWRLILYWQALQAPVADAKVFVHLVDAEGRIVAQEDSVPAGWERPTSGWSAGEVVVDAHILALPDDLASGPYTVFVGMYDEATWERWPVVDSAGSAPPDGRLPLTTLQVGP